MSAKAGSSFALGASSTSSPAIDERRTWTFTPGAAGFTQLLMSADCPAGSDASLKRLPVVRAAAEQVVTVSGTVREEATIEVPKGVDPRASRLEITFAPSLAADMADTLNYLVEYPYGCVEQTMSRFLPAVMVKHATQQAAVSLPPEVAEKLPDVLDRGLVSEIRTVEDRDAWAMSRRLAREEGLLVGISAGANVHVACQVARELGPGKRVLTVLCDTGERYFSLDEYFQ